MKKAISVALINNEGKLLVEKHVKCKGLWVMPCGKVEEGEELYEAAIREMREELGINLEHEPLIKLFTRNSFYSRIDGDQLFEETVFTISYNERCHGKIENMEPEKHTELRWIDPVSEVYHNNQDISENTRIVLDMINSGNFAIITPLTFNNPKFVYKSTTFDLSTIEGVAKMIECIIEKDENLTLNVAQETDENITLTCNLTPTFFASEKSYENVVIPLKGMDNSAIKVLINSAKFATMFRKVERFLIRNGVNEQNINDILPYHFDEEKLVQFDSFSVMIRKVLMNSEVKFKVSLCSMKHNPCELLEKGLFEHVFEYHINCIYDDWLKSTKQDKVLVTKIHPEAIIPEKAHPTDSGMDLFAVGEYELQPGDIKLIKTGIKIILPEGYEAQVRPKSGLALKQGLTVLNTPGTVDEEYRGEVGVILVNHGNKPVQIKSQQKIAQMVISKVDHIPTLEISNEEYLTFDTERGEGGFGSTGLTSKDKS